MQKRYAETGVLAKPLQDEPELYIDLYPIWDGFWILKGNYTDALKFADIVAYWKDVVGVGPGELQTILKYMRRMDETHLKLEEKNAIRDKPKNSR